MIARLIILGAIVLALVWFLGWFRRTPPAQVAAGLRRAALYGVIGVLVLAAATGRVNPLFAAIAAAIPFVIRAVNLLRVLPALHQLLRMLGLSGIPGTAGGGAGAPGRTSSIRTRFFEMTLEHATGRMNGRVLEGPYEGRLLSELDLDALLQLLARCQSADAQSAAVLEAYLDRVHGDAWRDKEAPQGKRAPRADGKLSRDEAFAVLGLGPGASSEDIREAHRRLMQKLHPDRGGSDYLAAQINQAKQLLLGE